MERYIYIGSKRIFVNIIGNENNIPILYIHGAPGIGVIDFVSFQGENFKKDYYLVSPEQRGVWRSEKIDGEYDICNIIEDYERIRKILKINKWVCICHCFGARIAIQYYKKYPNIFEKIIFESPVFNTITPFNELIKIELKILKEKFDESTYKKYMDKALEVKNPIELEYFCNKLGKKLNINTNSFTMSKKTISQLTSLKNEFNYDLFMKSRATEIKMCYNIELYRDISFMYEDMAVPTLIMKGEQDVVVPMNVVNNFCKRVLNTNVVIFKDSKHWVHIDRPVEFFKKVDEFIKNEGESIYEEI